MLKAASILEQPDNIICGRLKLYHQLSLFHVKIVTILLYFMTALC